MYQVLLILHSWLRWFVLGAGLLATVRAYVGWTGRRPFTKGDNAISAAKKKVANINYRALPRFTK